MLQDISESKIFKKEDVLSQDYLPEILPFRESKIRQIADNLQPAATNRKPQNVFIFGPPGTGKTASTKFVFREFENYSRIKTIYINCWDYKTAHAVLTKIALDMETFVPRKGIAKDEVLEKVIETCKKTNKGFVICLDEVDQLEEEALYDLLRINQYVSTPFGLIFISNNSHVFMNCEPRIRSSLAVDEIEFEAYSLEEMKNILQERVKYAFHNVEGGVVLLCANHAIKNGGDVRIGLQCLMKAGRLAEQEHANRLQVNHVKKVLQGVKPVKPEILLEKVNDTEKIIVEIARGKKMLSGELYEEYCKRVGKPIDERSFRDCVNHLAEVGLVKVIERKRGVRGHTREITAKKTKLSLN
jgi:cell division control protein 6